MFVNSTHLPQRLRPEDYVSEDVYQKELTGLFLPAWHCVATVAEIPKVGDFRSAEILGRPLIIWNTAEGYRTYLNVCSHRFCKLTNETKGHAAKTIKCQYHGWEYDASGNTCKIPDAQSFRPLAKGELGLREYRTDTAGQMICVSLEESGPSLAEFLGTELAGLCNEWFGFHARHLSTIDLQLGCNWKIAIENVLESYHVESVHPQTFGRYPEPQYCQHKFYENHDHYTHDYTHEFASAGTFPERFVAWLSGQPAELQWHHILRYPNMVFGKGGPVAYLQMFWPVTATTCRCQLIAMDRPGPHGRIGSELAHLLLKYQGTAFIRRVLNEDARMYPSVQHGTAAPDRPYGGGLISTREERIFAFQERVLRALRATPNSTDVSAPAACAQVAAAGE